MKSNLKLLYEGDVWHVKILQTELEGLGIDTFVADGYVPPQDAHMTGAPTSPVPLYVQGADLDRARQVIEKRPGDVEPLR